MEHKYEIINIDNLIVNPENYRFDPVGNEYDAIKIMLDTHNKAIKQLLVDILENGLNPSDPLVVHNIGNEYITLEGNRRLTSLKIINNVNLLKSIDINYYNEYKKILDKANKSISIDLNNIPCINFADPTSANKWVSLKHTGSNGGKGTIRWGTAEKRRFKDKTSNEQSTSLVINSLLDYIKSSPFYVDSIKNNLAKIPITNLERLIFDPLVRDVIGIDITKGMIYKLYPDQEIAKPLTKILDDLISKRLVVTKIYTKDLRTEYTSTFTPQYIPDVTKKLDNVIELNDAIIKIDTAPILPEGPQQTTLLHDKNKDIDTKTANSISYNNDTADIGNIIKSERALDIDKSNNAPTFTEKNTSKYDNSNDISRTAPKDKHDINNRKYLIPGRVQIRINNPRINQVYKELKKMDVSQLPNAVAVLFRVFIEISMDEYIEKNNLTSVNTNSQLNKKVQACLEDLKSKKLLSQDYIKPVNVSISDKDSMLSINTFNSYVHNKHMFPDSLQLKNSWNQLEGFLVTIHKNC
jgi:hypothetical protein